MTNFLSKILWASAVILFSLALVSCGDPEPREGSENPENTTTGGAGTGSITGYLCYVKDTSNPYGGGSRHIKTLHFNGSGIVKYWEEYTTSNSSGGVGSTQPTVTGTYTVSGDEINVKDSGGSIYQGKAHHRYQGQITEIYFNGDYYAKGLCN
jgi:hypothetical protein